VAIKTPQLNHGSWQMYNITIDIFRISIQSGQC